MHFVSSEALLEMYFLQSTLKELGSMYGNGNLRLIKPSPHDEKWIGIDQAWVSSSMTDAEFVKGLAKTVVSGSTPPFYFAVFRQYKRVERILKSSIYTPYKGTTEEWGCPYYRCDIYTKPNQENHELGVSGSSKLKKPKPVYSQHEALIRLAALPDADVHYVCPMIFSPLDVWQPADMSRVRIVPVRSTYPTFANDDEKHHLCFRTTTDTSPEFHSENGIQAESISFREWKEGFEHNQKRLDAERLLTTLLAADSLLEPETNLTDSRVLASAKSKSKEILKEGSIGKEHLARDLTPMLSIIEFTPH